MPLSRDPERRKRQLSNLNRGAATKHGAYSNLRLGPLREHFAEQLHERFGDVASADEIALAAERRAKLEALNAWLDRSGLLERSGRPRAAVQLADRLQTMYERQIAELRGRSGRKDRSTAPDFSLELADDEKVGLMSADPKVRADASHRVLARLHERSPGDA